MSMFNKIFICLLVGLFEIGTAFGVDVSSLRSEWGEGKLDLCSEPNLSDDMCIWGDCANTRNVPYCYNGHSVYMMIARQFEDDCAQFCPTAVNSCRNVVKSYANAYTTYSTLGDVSDCVWLCKDGVRGNNQNQVCDTEELTPASKNYRNMSAGGTNIEDNIPMFINRNNGCNANGSQEHDMVLAVVDWFESGRGAEVQQMMVRAYREGDKSDFSAYPKVYPAKNAEKIVVCRSGYKPNQVEDDCEIISGGACDVSTESSAVDAEQLSGVDNEGIEVTCKPKEEIWNNDTRSCVRARALSKQIMQRCWMRTDYKNCVLGEQ